MKTQKGKDYPTMKTVKNHPQVEEKGERFSKLQKQFMNLQQDWDFYKHSNPAKTKRRHSTSSSNLMVKKSLDQLLDTSPRHLMSSLQQGEWKLRSNDLEVAEIRTERRAAIESGKLKGRRLFQAELDETEMGIEVRSVSFHDSDEGDQDDDDDSGKSKEIAVCFQGSFESTKSSSSSSTSSISFSLSHGDVKREVKIEEGMEMVDEGDKSVADKNGGGNGARRCMVMIILWVAIASLVFAVCFDRGFAGYGNDHEVILVPT